MSKSYNSKKVKKLIILAFVISVFLSILAIKSSAQYVYTIDTFYGFTITYDVTTLSNGTIAFKWISGDYNSVQKQQIC